MRRGRLLKPAWDHPDAPRVLWLGRWLTIEAPANDIDGFGVSGGYRWLVDINVGPIQIIVGRAQRR